MKYTTLFFLTLFIVAAAFAQKETFDITTYTAPAKWKKEITASIIQFTKEDAVKGTYCIITLYKSVPGTANSKDNFDMAWISLVKEMVNASSVPTMQPSAIENGWEAQTGYAPFESDGNKGVALLITSTGFEKMVNVIILTNTDVYQKEMTDFLESISLKKTRNNSLQPAANSNNAAITGTWGISNTTASYYNTSINEGSTITQYTFNADSTYSFYIKTFKYQLDKLLLTRETGTYKISGNTLIINPQKSATEAWSRKDGTDKWGKLLSSQKKELEKATYYFSIENFGSGNVLILKGPPTKRDGNYNNSNKDAWFYPAKSNIELIKLPG